MRSPFRSWMGLAALLVLATGTQPATGQTAARPLQVGVLPNLSARVLIEQNQPLRQYLERRLGRPAEIVSAPDFRVYHERTMAGAYDVAVTAAHMARVAQLDAHHVPLAVYAPNIECMIVTAKGSGLKSVEMLRGQSVTFANPLSLVALHGRQWLSEQGLRYGVDYHVQRVRADDSVVNLLLRGDSAAGLLSGGELRSIPAAQRERLNVMLPFGSVRAFIVLANPRLSPAALQQLRTVFLEFPKAEEFAAFSAATGFKDLEPIDEAAMRAFDPIVEETRRMLSGGS